MDKCFKCLFFLLVILLLMSCDSKSNLENEIKTIPVEFDLIRFDRIFAQAQVNELPQIKKKYALFFPEEFPDSIWVNRLQDTLQHQLNEAVLESFPESNALKEDLTSLFQHITYYYPEFDVPKVYTVTSDVDYRTKVIATDSLLILELDTFLGRDHVFYEGLPKYVAQNLDPSQLLPNVATAYARKLVVPPRDRTLLAQMIYYGKILYLNDLWLPEIPVEQKLGYSKEDLDWALMHEEDIWKYFIEKEYLYATDTKLQQRFIDPAPFSKFNLEIDNQSPGMVGRWLGWQIVRSYMDNNDTSLYQLMEMPAETIFINSKYKPRK